jgi:hypothetical protein
MELNYEAPEERHIQALLADLAKDDEQELLAQAVRPEWGIRTSIQNSTEVVAISNGANLGCIVGLVETGGLSPQVYPWLLGTNYMQRYPLTIMRISKRLIKRWTAQHPYMYNFVDQRHKRAIAWLSALGADFEEIPAHGPYRRPFYKFTFGSPPCV